MRTYSAFKVLTCLIAVVALIGCRSAKNGMPADSTIMSRSSTTPNWGNAQPSDPKLAAYMAADERLTESNAESSSPRSSFGGAGASSASASSGCSKGCCN